ncbi:PhzF family phenazine biosynthesis protein [Oricola cellulosilytica]|uniref:PhzF family phenazine biosynthesis protein n=1 Tax=Oricola cellulosilytica TaxID=1429082 RepID=A0A4V2MNT0_9HYPH|nr:PhzF family phenazine biosynthesis protein [Oricola cellulosilytica]TCD14407.1 PhzF family phenazine biosynthesis protein [Oricola cellulosilytica]
MSERHVFYSIVDVFTRTRFSGNPVAVIHDASEIDTSQMLAIAREFGFSETTFILPPSDPETIAQVRIFTPFEEVPFAGHPNIGTAFVLATRDTAARGPLTEGAVFDEPGGVVRVRLTRENGVVTGAVIEAPHSLQKLGNVDSKLAARCLGLAERDIVSDRITPCVASVGLPFAFLELRSLEALGAITPDVAAFRDAADAGPRTVDGFAVCAFVVMEENEPVTLVRSRVLSPLGHPAEDPATGSASGALAALLSEVESREGGVFRVTQGVEIGRPGEIGVEIIGTGRPPLIRGDCVMAGGGTMFV